MGEFLRRQPYFKSPSACLQAIPRRTGTQSSRGRVRSRERKRLPRLLALPPPLSSCCSGRRLGRADPTPFALCTPDGSLWVWVAALSQVLPPCLFPLPAFIPHLSPLSFIANNTNLTLLTFHQHLSESVTLLPSSLFIQQTPLQNVVVDLRGW